MPDEIDKLLHDDPDPLEKLRIQRRIDNATYVLSSPQGRAFVLDILSVCHYGLSPFTGENNHTNMIAGKQKVGEEIMSLMNQSDPMSFFTATKEAKELEAYDNGNDDDHNGG